MVQPTPPAPSSGNTSAGTGAAAAPLAGFDPVGTGAVISYQVPEPTSYTGRHVLTLNYDLTDFPKVINASAGNAPGNDGSGQGQLPPALAPSSSAPLTTTGTQTPAPAPAPTLAASVLLPRSVVASDFTNGSAAVVAVAPFPQSDRLTALTWDQVSQVAAGGKRVEVFRSVAGQLDYRVRAQPGPAAATTTAAAGSSLRAGGITAALLPVNRDGSDGPGGHQYVDVWIDSPAAGSPALSGPWNGLQLTISGRVQSHLAGPPGVTVDLVNADGQKVATAGAGGDLGETAPVPWSVTVPVLASGSYKLIAVAAAPDAVTQTTATVSISVTLAPPPAQPPPTQPAVAPSLTMTSPAVNCVVVDPDGTVLLPVAGTVDTNGGAPVTVSMTVDHGVAAPITLGTATGTVSPFSTSVLVTGDGMHTLLVTAVNQDGVAAPALSIPFMVSASQPVTPIDRRLLLIETIGITSFLGNFGASRVIKTLSLMPGEQTTISVDSYTKDDTTSHTASSIVDSAATESAADFEDTLNQENDTKAATADATTVAISADLGASWGWGHADIKAGYTDQSNASRENTTNTVQKALAQHTSKASNNRTVSVNTDFSDTSSQGLTTDTTRTLKNINVSRVLNFVFRQLTQEHRVVIHLIGATVGYYTQDELADASGKPLLDTKGNPVIQESFTEYTLPEVAQFAADHMSPDAKDRLAADITNVLSTIPDYQGNQQSIVETVTPVSTNGTPDPSSAYLRIKPNLTQTYTDPAGVASPLTVPGVILGYSTHVLRTDQLVCDAILGAGDALDTYSHALQDVAIAERQAAVDERAVAIAREKLAQQIIASKDADMAAVWQKIYPPALSVPATITVPATTADGADGSG